LQTFRAHNRGNLNRQSFERVVQETVARRVLKSTFAGADTVSMKFSLMIALAAFLALAGIRLSQSLSHSQACARFEHEIARVRSLTPDNGPRTAPSAAQERLEGRLAELDAELDRIAPADLGIGAPWMWTPDHREELAGLVEMVRPLLVEIIELSSERKRGFEVGRHASLLRSRHRANLMCASALVEDDGEAAAQWLIDALAVAAAEDDGSIIAGMIVNANVGIVVLATRRLSERPDFERERLVCALDPWLREFEAPHQLAVRVATEAVSFADRGGHRACPTKSVESLRRFLEALEPLLAGRGVASVPRTALEGLEAPFGAFATVLRPEFLQAMRHNLRF
jgi:hypothetical protein